MSSAGKWLATVQYLTDDIGRMTRRLQSDDGMSVEERGTLEIHIEMTRLTLRRLLANGDLQP